MSPWPGTIGGTVIAFVLGLLVAIWMVGALVWGIVIRVLEEDVPRWRRRRPVTTIRSLPLPRAYARWRRP